MKKVNVIGYKEVGFDYNVCDEIYENGCGKDIEGRLLDVEFWKIVFEDRLEWEKNELFRKNVSRMVENISKLDGDVLVEF
jgi:argonaute-like protein implicated in RNA metabolism and viral defense